MGRSIPVQGDPANMGKIRRDGIFTGGIPMPVVPTENKGIMSGPMRRKRKGRIDRRGSRRDGIFGGSSVVQVTMKDPKTGRMYGGMVKDGVPQFKKPDFVSDEDFNKSFPKDNKVYAGGSSPIPGVSGHEYVNNPKYRRDRINRERKRRLVGRRMPPPPRKLSDPDFKFKEPDFMSGPKRPRPLTGGYDPVSGVRYTDRGVPTAVEQTRRVPVQDPTLGGLPEREVPIPKERRQRITRESDPRGGAPFSPDERGMARDRFFERMFDRADERKQQKAMERAERDNVGDALRSERELRQSELAGPGDERQGRRGEGGMRRRRRGGGMRRRRRRRDFTRRRSQMEGGRRGRSGREMAEFRDQYVSTLR